MNLADFKPTIHSDLSIGEEELYKQHREMINNKQYVDAATLLNEHKEITNACTATLLNGWEQKINTLDALCEADMLGDQLYILSDDEPDENWMVGKKVWRQKY